MITVAGLGLCALLAVIVLPLPRVRQAVLAFAARAGWSGVLAAVAAGGTFFARPDTVPGWAAPHAGPVLDGVRAVLPCGLAAHPGLPWLVLAAAVVAVSLPVLSVVEFAARVTGQTATLHALRRELRAAAGRLDRTLAGLDRSAGPAASAELAVAADALRAAAGDRPAPRPAGPRLVRDLL